MTACRWDREFSDYLTPDGKPCLRDDYGDPTRHCTARRTCSQHVGARELTCAKCIGRTRQDIRAIVDLAALMPVEALVAGVQSEAANLAGPAADTEAWSWRKVTAKQGGAWHVSLVEDDDDNHPYTVLARWEFMLREDYHQCRDAATSISEAAAYLERTLPRMAQDDGQDFPLFREEMRACRRHLEGVIHNSRAAEKGAPCPDCGSAASPVFVRLQREYAHWCEDPDCERIHYPTDEADRWVCPRNREHAWTEKAYRDYIEERTA